MLFYTAHYILFDLINKRNIISVISRRRGFVR
jgi:hypothetical protein